MSKYALSIPILVALFAGINAKPANAQGIHFRSGGIHVDFGRPHYGHSYYGGHGHGWHGGYGHGHWNTYGGWGGHHDWHDTTHLDYHPGGYVPHYDHYDYVPGHYDVHHSGHWDYHGF